MQGFMKKLASKRSIFNENKFQLRYFFLDLTQALFKYGQTPVSKQTINAFRELLSLDENPKPEVKIDRDYPYTFLLHCTGRDFFLACKTQ